MCEINKNQVMATKMCDVYENVVSMGFHPLSSFLFMGGVLYGHALNFFGGYVPRGFPTRRSGAELRPKKLGSPELKK